MIRFTQLFEHLKDSKEPELRGKLQGANGAAPGNWEDFHKKATDILSSCTPFILRLPEKSEPVYSETDPESELDLPFSTCWFEPFDPARGLVTLVTTETGESAVVAVGIREVSPREYDLLTMEMNLENGEVKRTTRLRRTLDDQRNRIDVMSVVKPLLNLLHTGQLATEKTNLKFVSRNSSGEKTFTRIKRVVHVLPKKDVTAKSESGVPLDWSHRWEVRGHWRKCSGIGKNRQGEYVVMGNTWVVPFVKGPEEKPLVKKTYFVDRDLQ